MKLRNFQYYALSLVSYKKNTCILLKSDTQNYHHISGIGGWEVCTTTLLNLSENWVICIEKGGPNNFAQVITILSNLYSKHCLLIKKMLMKYLRLKFFLPVI